MNLSWDSLTAYLHFSMMSFFWKRDLGPSQRKSTVHLELQWEVKGGNTGTVKERFQYAMWVAGWAMNLECSTLASPWEEWTVVRTAARLRNG